MNKQEALEKLELEVGASEQDIKKQYQEFYNEFQMRITNAPTTHLKSLYQKNFKQLEEAYSVLTGQETSSFDSEIPWVSPGQTEENLNSINEALKLIGFEKPYTISNLNVAYGKKNTQITTAHFNSQYVGGNLEKDINKLNNAYDILLNFISKEVQGQIVSVFINDTELIPSSAKNPNQYLVKVNQEFRITYKLTKELNLIPKNFTESIFLVDGPEMSVINPLSDTSNFKKIYSYLFKIKKSCRCTIVNAFKDKHGLLYHSEPINLLVRS
ncbi:hypothetical protein [Tamlana flava]|uniref:hypothetical protein n=1 Tax=Tamlana flava TaxID=3158572 RepID=UPI00351B2BF2